MADTPHPNRSDPVKQRQSPVACKRCGRINWSLEALCVYCRLGWPDPSEGRDVKPDADSAGTPAVGQKSPTDISDAPQAEP